MKLVPLSRGRRDVSRFLAVPHAIYRDDPNWVAPLEDDLKKVFTDANPLFEHAEMQLWVAERDGRDVGRIAGILDRAHNDFHRERSAFFGFFESVDDPEVSRALFERVEAWAKERGMERILGPMNPTTNDECGLLVEGFDSPPVLMMTYNPEYYMKLFADAGLAKAKDLLAYRVVLADKPLARLSRLSAGFERRQPELRVRPIRKKTLKADLTKVKEVYNAAWEENWGFVPMTDGDIDFMAARLKPLLVEDLVLLAETPQEPVAFMMSLPDYNEAMKPLRGKLLTPKIFGFLAYLLGWKKPRMTRLITLGIKKSHRNRGIDAVMFAHSLQAMLAAGYEECEISWILEDNVMVQRPIALFDGEIYKRYRIYEKSVAS
ncbi:MAG TPA: GNAT family N-acetyltransferase [Thermoanaerobaculia bacterium]|nr:GNAT family N-acetyltransferase [Thermoanaerobaculia bacterium]